MDADVDAFVERWRLEREAKEIAARERELWRYTTGRRWLLHAPRAWLRGRRYTSLRHRGVARSITVTNQQYAQPSPRWRYNCEGCDKGWPWLRDHDGTWFVDGCSRVHIRPDDGGDVVETCSHPGLQLSPFRF